MTTLTKDERYEIYRLAKRARGLYIAEKQALVFVGDAQTMQDGVCRKALKNAEELGFGARQIRFGLRGRKRNGRTEFPGLIARGIVSAVSNEKGGRAPGGQGLPAVYSINRDVLLKFVPEIDCLPEKDEPKAEPSSKKDEPLGEPKEELMPPRSCSSFSSFFTLNNCPSVEPTGERSEGHVVDDGETLSQSPAAPADDCVLAPSACASGRTPSSEEEKTNTKSTGRENQPLSESPDLEARTEHIIYSARQLQLDRKASVAEMYRDYKAVFDRLTLEEKISLKWTPPKESHKQKAAELYRAIGRDAALSKWEQFLTEGEHEVPQHEFDEQLGRNVTFDVQRTWLLLCFVNENSVPAK